MPKKKSSWNPVAVIGLSSDTLRRLLICAHLKGWSTWRTLSFVLFYNEIVILWSSQNGFFSLFFFWRSSFWSLKRWTKCSFRCQERRPQLGHLSPSRWKFWLFCILFFNVLTTICTGFNAIVSKNRLSTYTFRSQWTLLVEIKIINISRFLRKAFQSFFFAPMQIPVLCGSENQFSFFLTEDCILSNSCFVWLMTLKISLSSSDFEIFNAKYFQIRKYCEQFAHTYIYIFFSFFFLHDPSFHVYYGGLSTSWIRFVPSHPLSLEVFQTFAWVRLLLENFAFIMNVGECWLSRFCLECSHSYAGAFLLGFQRVNPYSTTFMLISHPGRMRLGVPERRRTITALVIIGVTATALPTYLHTPIYVRAKYTCAWKKRLT